MIQEIILSLIIQVGGFFGLGFISLYIMRLNRKPLKQAFDRFIDITFNTLKVISLMIMIFAVRILCLVGLIMGAPALLITCK